MRPISVLVVLFVLLIASCQSPSYQIAYITDRTSNFDIFITNETGAYHKQLTKNPGWDWSPKWNPYLGGILYNQTDSMGEFSIQLMSSLGEPMLVSTYELEEFILSPDGSVVLFTQKDSLAQAIWALDVRNGRKWPVVTTDSSYNGRPKWSPDGKLFSFISDRDGNNDIYLFDWATQTETPVTQSPEREKYTSWAPDNRSIYFTRQREGLGYNDIFVIDIIEVKEVRITDDEDLYEEINCSPDGEKLAYHAKIKEQDHLIVLDLETGQTRQITKVDAYHGEPEWIPILL
jgi:Tol biopolymer transport system component